MAHLATKRFNHWSQLGILTAFLGVGFILAGIASFIPVMGKLNLDSLKSGSQEQIMNDFLKPENANALRWMQFLSTLFLFFVPPVIYALICHKKPFLHLGYRKELNIQQVLLVIFIMLMNHGSKV